ncbi:MAG: desulfoferrodoxin [Treponema sp.]|nr:desulfoferrodoxin [Treponema sp.]
MKAEFYICKHCGNIIEKIKDAGVPVSCCGEKMSLLEPNTTDASNEKHLPVVTVNGTKVNVVVSSVEHPMEEKHWIQWIYLETDKGRHRYNLNPSDKPVAVFNIAENEKPLAAYEYCNLHGLWVTKI